MTLAEDSRQYQSVLEARRRVRTELLSVISGLDVLDAADEELVLAFRRLEAAWLEDLAA